MSKSYQIVVICDHAPVQDYYCFKEFQKSLYGEPIIVLGWGTGEYKNLSDRPRILQHYLKQGVVTTPNIIYCDCWDLVFVDKPELILEKHRITGNDLTVSAEKNCFPPDYKEQFDSLPYTSSYRYLNCGFFVGKTEAMITILESMGAANKPKDYFDATTGKNFHYNEQGWFMEEFLKQPVSIGLDYKQDFCQCLQNVAMDDLDFSEPKIRNKETDAYSSIQHFNGTSKTDGLRFPILKHLNLI